MAADCSKWAPHSLRDFGGLRRGAPARIHAITTIEQAREAVAAAAADGLQVSVRGLGHSCNGQTVSDGGVMIDLSSLSGVEAVGEGFCEVLGGTCWADVVDATLGAGQIPPVLPDYLGLTVGGTLSIGGLGGTSFREGTISDQLLAADVVTAEGTLVHCSPQENAELFHCIKGGAGQFGVIVRARVRLTPGPSEVECIRLIYPEPEPMLLDQVRLLAMPGLWHLGGWVLPLPEGWTPCMELAFPLWHKKGEGETSSQRLPADLRAIPRTTQIMRVPLRHFLHRLNEQPAFPCNRGPNGHAHPWMSAFLPSSTAPRFLKKMLGAFPATEMGPAGVVEVYPVSTASLGSVPPVWPLAETVFMVSAFPCQIDMSANALVASEARNRRIYDLSVELGGTGDPQASAVFLSPADWQRQLGPALSNLLAARSRLDPRQRFKSLPGLDQAMPHPSCVKDVQ